ncbi:Uncharacterised protein [uncultured archaeon]|nr:Uncharacterised protein [uncultured archaeon]
MNKNSLVILSFAAIILLGLNIASAMVVNSVTSDKIYPGQSGQVSMKVENTLSVDAQDVSISLNLANTGFSTEGSSEKSVDHIDNEDEENFKFILKAAPNTKTGDYNIPYTLTYYLEGLNGTLIPSIKTGTFGITVIAQTELQYDILTENNIIGQKGKATVQITNKGLGDIGFASVRILSENGVELIGLDNQYIGTVRSDDSGTATFDVVYKSENAQVTAEITYKDSENNAQTETVVLPIKAYTPERALELGLVQKNYTWVYVTIIIVLIIIYIIYKRVKKAKKKNGLR